MYSLDPQQEIKQLDKKLIMLNIIDAPAMILIGLGIFGKFGGNPAGLHPLLANSEVTTAMLAVGSMFAAWCGLQVFKTASRRNELMRQISERQQ